jgi:hypothetical protein
MVASRELREIARGSAGRLTADQIFTLGVLAARRLEDARAAHARLPEFNGKLDERRWKKLRRRMKEVRRSQR